MSGSRARLVKLVRDRVGGFCQTGGVAFEPIPAADVPTALRTKLLEEVGEYLLTPTIGELADVLEVVRALAHADLGVDLAAVVDEADLKRAERGGFDHGIGMYVETSAPLRHEGGSS